MVSKLQRALQIIKQADEVLDAIDSTIDLPRLITTSNAQGNLAKIVRDAVSAAAQIGSNSQSDDARRASLRRDAHLKVKRVPKRKRLK